MKAIILLAFIAVATALPRSAQFIRPGIGTKVVGGENAGEKEFPFHVTLLVPIPFVGNYPFCAAVIYDENRVLTSATCAVFAVNEGLEQITVVAGSHTLETTGEEQIRGVIGATVHEKYSGTETYENDIAILTLDSPVVYTGKVQPLRLALSTSATPGEVITIGHGSTRSDGEGLASILQKATLKTITQEDCTHDFESVANAPAITNTMTCGSGTTKSICAGDLGGALVAKDEAGRRYLAGVASFGVFPCGDYPSVFTNIASLRPWLDSKLNH